LRFASHGARAGRLGFVFLTMAEPGYLYAERSGGDGAWNHPCPPGAGGLSAAPTLRWKMVPSPIARLQRIHQSNCQRSRARQSTVWKSGTRWDKRKLGEYVFGMIWCDGSDGFEDSGDSGCRPVGHGRLSRLAADRLRGNPRPDPRRSANLTVRPARAP